MLAQARLITRSVLLWPALNADIVLLRRRAHHTTHLRIYPCGYPSTTATLLAIGPAFFTNVRRITLVQMGGSDALPLEEAASIGCSFPNVTEWHLHILEGERARGLPPFAASLADLTTAQPCEVHISFLSLSSVLPADPSGYLSAILGDQPALRRLYIDTMDAIHDIRLALDLSGVQDASKRYAAGLRAIIDPFGQGPRHGSEEVHAGWNADEWLVEHFVALEEVIVRVPECTSVEKLQTAGYRFESGRLDTESLWLGAGSLQTQVQLQLYAHLERELEDLLMCKSLAGGPRRSKVDRAHGSRAGMSLRLLCDQRR